MKKNYSTCLSDYLIPASAPRRGIQFITYLQFIPGCVISVAEKQAADSCFIRNKMKKMFEAKFCSAQIFHTSITTGRD